MLRLLLLLLQFEVELRNVKIDVYLFYHRLSSDDSKRTNNFGRICPDAKSKSYEASEIANVHTKFIKKLSVINSIQISTHSVPVEK